MNIIGRQDIKNFMYRVCICSPRMFVFSGARKAVQLSQFGNGNGNFLMDDANCTGNELSLEDCARKPWKDHNCKSYETAGVICHPSKGQYTALLTTPAHWLLLILYLVYRGFWSY